MRCKILAGLLLLGCVLIVSDVYGHGSLVRKGEKQKIGEREACVSGLSIYRVTTTWKRSNLYSEDPGGDTHSKAVNPVNHYHVSEWTTSQDFTYPHPRYSYDCDVWESKCADEKVKKPYGNSLGYCFYNDTNCQDGYPEETYLPVDDGISGYDYYYYHHYYPCWYVRKTS